MIVVAYYTLDTSYESEAAVLRSSLERVGMKHEIVGIPSMGDWYANTSYKAAFLLDQRTKKRGPILYLDVDAFVHENCEAYFDQLAVDGFDFGAHWFRGPPKGHDSDKVCACIHGEPCDQLHRFLSGTLFFGDTHQAKRLLSAWIETNQLFRHHGLTQGGGQKNLWFILTCMEKVGLRVKRIPGCYCYVFDKPWAYKPSTKRVIEHTIASRENRDGRRRNDVRQSRIAELRRGVSCD